jgi:Dolichyl-phosphate-mannose-protein mannosyltransferase
MGSDAKLTRRFSPAVAVLIGALVVGAAARLSDLTSHSLFIDEGFTFVVAGNPLPAMLHEIVHHDFHPPLFYLITHYLMSWLHWQVWDYRFLTAPLGLVTIAATWAIARRSFGDVAACVAAVVVAIDPSLIEWDRMYRMYGLMTALAALSWWLLLAAREASGRARLMLWIAYAAVSVVQPYVHYLGALDVLCQGAFALTDLRKMWPAIASGGIAAAALIPWLWAVRIQYPNGGLVEGTAAVPVYWWATARVAILAGAPITWLQQPWFDPALSLFVIAIAAAGIARGPKTILPFWLAVAALQVVLTLATGKALVVPRYLEHVVPAIAIAFGATIEALGRTKVRIVALAGAIAIPAVLAVGCADLLWDPFYQLTDWYLVNLLVLQHEEKGDAFMFDQGFPYIVVGDFSAFRNRAAAAPAMPSDVPYAITWLQRHSRDRVWYIENQFYYPDPKRQIKAYLDKTRSMLFVRSELKSDLADVVNVILYSPAVRVPGPAEQGPRHRPSPRAISGAGH